MESDNSHELICHKTLPNQKKYLTVRKQMIYIK